MQATHVWRLALQDVPPGGAGQDKTATGEAEPDPAVPCSRRLRAERRQLYVN